MRKLLVAIAFTALASGPALAFGPSPSDADPPGALFASRPGGIDHVPNSVLEMQPGWYGARRMRSAPVAMPRHHRYRSRWHAR